MGVIRKQSIQGSVSLYIGVFIGFITSALLFPKFLNTEQIGLLNILLSYSTVFAQLASLGFNSVIIRNFSYFRNYENKHNHFFVLVFLVMVAGSILAILAFYFLKPMIIRQNDENAHLFVVYIDYLVPLIVFSLIFLTLDAYYTVLYKSVRGIILKEVIQRVLIMAAVCLYYIRLYDIEGLTIAYVIALSFPSVIMLLFIIAEGEWVLTPKFDYISRDMAKSMVSVALFGIITSLVGSANMQIDKAMAGSMISLEATGIYSTVFIFASLIKVPSRAVLKISSAVIADAWKREDENEINEIYKQTCLNQYIIGLLVLIGIWGNIDNIFKILPAEYVSGKYAILWLGIAFTFEMASGASPYIIATSKNYKILTWMVVATLGIMVVTNLIFIPPFGITGVAVACSVTTILYFVMRTSYLKVRYNMQPFNLKFLVLTGIGVVTYLISLGLPTFSYFIIDVIVRSGIITLIYCTLLFLLKISPEINEKLVQIFNKYIKRME